LAVVAPELLIWATVCTALLFDFFNGFHDSANSISTIVATRVLKPVQAVSLAAAGNFVGILLGTEVARTIAKGIVDPAAVALHPVSLVLAALIGAIVWDLVTWLWGLPTSSSHALIGGFVGAATVAAGFSAVNGQGVLDKVIIPMVTSPIIAFFLALLFTMSIMRTVRRMRPHRVNYWFRKLQIVSSFFYSVTHGTNDAQKTMGIIVALLVANSMLPPNADVPLWVMLSAHAMISMGTFFGGWRIVRTMATRITKLQPYQGFGAETGGGLILLGTAAIGAPVSTTQVISGAIMGVGATRRLSAVRWGVTRKIVLAWVLTIPAAGAVGGAAFLALSAAGI
jgi:PiT family inorganic phosphate transporter